MLPSIVVLDGHTLNPGDLSWDGLRALGHVTVYDSTAPEDILSRIGNAEIVINNKCVLDEKILSACPNLKYIGVIATGYNVVDVKAAARLGIIVTNVPEYGTDSVAQYVFALILELCHHVGEHNRAVHAGEWIRSEHFCFWNYPLSDLKGRTLGIIGYGHIGRAVAKIGEAFGMRILAVSPHGSDECIVSLDRLLAESDIVSLHCPLKDSNFHLINKDTISKMKDGAFLINTARGPLVDEEALKEALLSGKLGGAAVDVVSAEPMKKDCPLLGVENCIITPHIAWASLESRARLMDIALENLRCFLNGQPRNCV